MQNMSRLKIFSKMQKTHIDQNSKKSILYRNNLKVIQLKKTIYLFNVIIQLFHTD